MMEIKLKRLVKEPILTGNPDNNWEASSCYNSAVIQHEGRIHLFYRATDHSSNGRECKTYKSYIGHAVSLDGIHFERDKDYALGPIPDSQEGRGCEDPRIVRIGDRFYMTYTGYGARFPGDYRICLAVSDDLIHWERKGVLLDESNKDAAFFPEIFGDEYLILHRRPPNIWLSRTRDFTEFYDHSELAVVTDQHWEDCKIGIAGPPLKTDEGYVLIYHGVSEREEDFAGRGLYKQYALGLMLLDTEDPTRVVYRQESPILVPELDWEKFEGHVPNVVFSCGQAVIGDVLYVYYGGADTALGVATCSMKDIKALFDKH